MPNPLIANRPPAAPMAPFTPAPVAPAAPAALPQNTAAGLQGRGQPLDVGVVTDSVAKFAADHPEQVAQIRQEIDSAVQSGELTLSELNMLAQLATTVLRDPGLYPQIRQFVIQQGIATEQDLPAQYDQGLVIAVLIAARAAQGAQEAGPPQDAQGPSMQDGGPVGPNVGVSRPVPIKAHTGEYVVPKHVVDMKGREFFDKLLAQYDPAQKK